MPGPRSKHDPEDHAARADRDASASAATLLEAALAAPTRDALLCAIAAAAVAPATPGGAVAHALRWDPITGLFETVTRVSDGDGDAIERHPEPRVVAWDLDAIGATARDAWLGRRPAFGPMAPGAPGAAAATCVAFPVRTTRREVGLVVVECAIGHDPLPEPIEHLARWVSLAAESWETARERARRAAHATALADLGRSALAPRNIAEVMHAAARSAAEHTRSLGAAVWAVDAAGAATLQVAHGSAGNRDRSARALHAVACAAIESRRARIAVPASDELLLPPEGAAELAAVAVLPVIAYGHAVGAIATWRGHEGGEPGGPEPDDLEYLAALASILGLAIEQARRVTELKDAERRARESAREARRREGLAALGEMASRASQEAVKPAASIRAFASRLLKAMPPEEPGREYVEIVQREVERLERILLEQRAHFELPPPAMRLVGLNGIVDGALQMAGETLVRRRARVLKRLAPDLPELLLDPRGIEHVTTSLLRFALDSIAVGGRVRIETRRLPQHVLFELGHDGAHVPGEAIDQLFLPFAGAGAGAGLSIAHRIIEQHGGELRVRADGEWTTVVTLTLPIVGNQDRRRKPRRGPRDRRHLAATG